jgi:predicted Rossmann-fold nucleotide-binding protein
VVLFGTEYWQGLGDWIRDRLLAQGMISPGDDAMVTVTDDPQTVLHIFQDCLRRNGISAVEP